MPLPTGSAIDARALYYVDLSPQLWADLIALANMLSGSRSQTIGLASIVGTSVGQGFTKLEVGVEPT